MAPAQALLVACNKTMALTTTPALRHHETRIALRTPSCVDALTQCNRPAIVRNVTVNVTVAVTVIFAVV